MINVSNLIVYLCFGVLLAPKNVSEGLYVFMSLIGLVLFFKRMDAFGVFVFFVSLCTALLVILSIPDAISYFLLLVESKIIVFPFAAFLFSRLDLSSIRFCRESVINGLLIINAIALILSGMRFRYIDFVNIDASLSIYMGVTLAAAYLMTSSQLKRLFLLFFIALSGSGTALASLIVGVFFANREHLLTKWSFRTISILVLLVFLVIGFFYYNLIFRSRSVFDLESLDRFQLMSAGLYFVVNNFDIFDYIIGYGVARDLLGIYSYFSDTATVLPWLIGSRASEGFTGLVFHNEYYRVFYNFGLLGLVAFFYILYQVTRHQKGLFAVVLAASFFTSTIYITSVIVFLLLFGAYGRSSQLMLSCRELAGISSESQSYLMRSPS